LRSRLWLRRMRSVHVIIATTTLAIPASAFALTGATTPSGHSENTPLQLRVTPRHVTFGHAVSVAGTAPATDSGKRVILQTAVRRSASWRQISAAQIGRDGTFRVRVTPRRSGVIRATEQAPATARPIATAAAAPGATSSPLKPVTVGARFTLSRHEFSVPGGSSMHVGGKLLPARAGRVVRLQGHQGAGWRTLASGRTGQRGGFAVRYRPTGGTGQHLRVMFGGDRGNARSVQAAGRLTVLHPTLASWYDDGGNTACGFHAGLGVANRTLPCGTKVALSYGGRTVTATVDDRGPYVGGREYDLNQTTAAALGFAGVGTVWAST
jgi:rare lipoprotein A